jgi:hypothetical protein
MLVRYLSLGCFLLMGLTSAARADLTYTFDNGGSCCGTGPFGTVLLHVIDADTVKVTETLGAGEVFAVGGAGNSLSFNVDEAFTYVPGTLTAGFTTGTSGKASPFGTFGAFVECGPTVCGNGTSPPEFSGPVTFELTNATGLTPADFISNGSAFFAADIGVPKAGGGFSTGNVAADKAPAVPEPKGTVFLFTSGLAVALWMFKKRLPV